MAGDRQLAAFEAVASELHFGRAAERLGIGQAAVSQLIRRLERECGVVLFSRSSHHVALTAEGASLLEPARAALAAHRAFDAAARGVASGGSGVLRIAPADATAGALAILLRRFAQDRPNVRIELRPVPSNEKVALLLEGEIDLAFTRAPVAAPGVTVERIWTEPLVALVPAAVEAAMDGADPLVLSALPLTIIARRDHPEMHAELVAQCRIAGIEPRLGAALGDAREGIAAIAAGQGWTLTARSVARHQVVEGVAIVAFDAPGPTTSVSLLGRSIGASAHARAFLDCARVAGDAGLLPG